MYTESNLKLVVNKATDLKYIEIQFIGNLDSFNLKEKRKELDLLVNTVDKPYLVFNFLNLTFINSESISFLMQVNEQLDKIDKSLVIVNAKKNVVDVLKVIGILDQIAYFPTMLDFLKTV